MKKLDNCTLCIIDCKNYGQAIQAIRKSQNQIEFTRTIFLTDIEAHNPNFPFEIIKIDKITSKAEYSRFVIKELYKHITTDYVLLIQHDGYILDGNQWDEKFLGSDYIGASWLESDGYNVGNGGFSLRSKRLQNILATDDFIQSVHSAEDVVICRVYRTYLEEKYGIKFAPEELADKFSFELREPCQKTFGFHGNFHKPYSPTIVIKRTGALGDVVALEPILHYYHKKGYKVAIDIPINLAMVYSEHYFKVYHISQLTDGRIPYTVVDLDGAYEEKPKQLHLKSYYEKAGITDGEIRNPKLNMAVDDSTRMFKRYAVLHIDERDQPHRNIYGVDWEKVVEYLGQYGITVIQAGMSAHEEVIGAIQMRTVTMQMLMYLVGGACMFIGIDSSISNIAVALNIPSIIFMGSVNPEYIYPDLSNTLIVSNHSKEKPICSQVMCWHNSITTTGQDCVEDIDSPPCTRYSTEQTINKITELMKNHAV